MRRSGRISDQDRFAGEAGVRHLCVRSERGAALADRICVMKKGKVLQIAPPARSTRRGDELRRRSWARRAWVIEGSRRDVIACGRSRCRTRLVSRQCGDRRAPGGVHLAKEGEEGGALRGRHLGPWAPAHLVLRAGDVELRSSARFRSAPAGGWSSPLDAARSTSSRPPRKNADLVNQDAHDVSRRSFVAGALRRGRMRELRDDLGGCVRLQFARGHNRGLLGIVAVSRCAGRCPRRALPG
jgi:hypothetical protein